MKYEIIDNISWADCALLIHGNTIEEIFHNSATALLYQLVDNPSSVNRQVEIAIQIENEKPDLLLYNTIEELLFIKDSRHILLVPLTTQIKKKKHDYQLVMRLAGEEIDRTRHNLKTDIKGITMHKLEISCSPEGLWQATFVLDV